MLNEDGFSVKGCSLIYHPKGQAGEYAKLACNPFRGCGHGCVYCYVPNVIQMARRDFDAGAKARDGFLTKLSKEAEKYQAHGIREQVMLSFTTDPFNPDDASVGFTRQVLEVLQAHDMGVCTLTKGGARALRDIDLFRPARDAFATTLTTLDDSQSREWEPRAALPADRIETLKRFHDAGIFTWVSLEPVYDTEQTIAIIRECAAVVDLFKVGRINHHRVTRQIDWQAFAASVLDVLDETGSKHYIKKDLQPYLPTGYDNPLYISQFN